MKTEELTRIDVIRILTNYKNVRNMNLISERVDTICDIISMVDDDQLKEFTNLTSFVNRIDSNRTSALDSEHELLEQVYLEIKAWLKDNIQPLKNKAICKVRKVKKKHAIWAVVFLSFVAGVVLILGVLSAVDIIDRIWCNLIGVFDCVFGVSFFIYDYCDDKLRTSEINVFDEKHIDEDNYRVLKQNINYGIQSRGWFTKNVIH